MTRGVRDWIAAVAPSGARRHKRGKRAEPWETEFFHDLDDQTRGEDRDLEHEREGFEDMMGGDAK